MDREILLGIVLLIVSLGLLTYFVLRARRFIRNVARKGAGSARVLSKENMDG